MKGFVLKTVPIQERSLIATVFFEDLGKVSIYAKNCIQSKRYGTAFQFFQISDFHFSASQNRSQDLLYTDRADFITQFDSLSKSIIKLSVGSYLNEIYLRVLPEQKKAPELYKLYLNTLIALNELPETKSILVLNSFLIKILQWLGIQPSITRCIDCKKTPNEFTENFITPHILRGGWLCPHCSNDQASTFTLHKELLTDAYSAMLQPIRKIEYTCDETLHAELLHYLEQHLIYHVPGLDQEPLKASRVLKSTLWPAQNWLDLVVSKDKTS